MTIIFCFEPQQQYIYIKVNCSNRTQRVCGNGSPLKKFNRFGEMVKFNEILGAFLWLLFSLCFLFFIETKMSVGWTIGESLFLDLHTANTHRLALKLLARCGCQRDRPADADIKCIKNDNNKHSVSVWLRFIIIISQATLFSLFFRSFVGVSWAFVARNSSRQKYDSLLFAKQMIIYCYWMAESFHLNF